MKPEAFNDLINTHSSLLVDFYADWCEPCKMLDGILDEMSEILTGRVEIIKVDIDKSDELKKEYGIMSVPTLILFKNGTPAWRLAGFLMAADLTRKIEEFI